MNKSPEEVLANYETFLGLIDKHISEPRKSKLVEFYNTYATRISTMPASSKEHHHNAFPGGYVDHVIRVVNIALNLKEVWASFDADDNYTTEELVFAALNHDLGKMGTAEHEMYQPNDSEWHRKNQGAIYKMNTEPDFMPIQDRSLYLLQQHNIPVTINEWIAIKSHDGLYDDANKAYFISYDPGSKMKTHFPILLHHADMAAARIEYETWARTKVGAKQPTKRENPLAEKANAEELKNIFGNLF